MNQKTKYKIPLIYAIFGVIWILSSDFILTNLAISVEWLGFWQRIKGIVYVVLSAVLFAFYIKRSNDYHYVRNQEEKLSAVINSLNDFVLFIDQDGKWTEMNDKTKEFLQIDEYVGKTTSELMAEQPAHFESLFQKTSELIINAWKEKSPQKIEHTLMINERELILSISVVPLFDKNGLKRGVFIVGRDITELKKKEEAAVKGEKLIVVGELAAGVAHEIRNPLTSIKGFVQVLEQDQMEDQRRLYLSIMDKEVDQIESVIGRLLSIAKTKNMQSEVLYLDDLVSRAIEEVALEARNKQIEIKLNKPTERLSVEGESSLLVQALVNIMLNAIEASDEGGRILSEISTVNGEYYRVKITDYGCGMSSDRVKRIGEPFYTVKEKGTGFGMTVCYKIIKEHGGRISISSELRKGTVVDVFLPASQMITETIG